MQYNKPFDQTDPNAPYNNGNPATGTDGSIPPAEAIEFPQREIVNVIQWAFDHGYLDQTGTLCAAPTNLDLQQLRKAIEGFIRSQQPFPLLKANTTSYINATLGSDTAYDGTSATVSGTHGPFATIQRGITEALKYNLGGFNYTIKCADGTYTSSTIGGYPQNGSGTIALVGNSASPASCVIGCPLGTTMLLLSGANYSIDGFRVTAGISPRAGDQNALIWAQGATLTIPSGATLELGPTTINNSPQLQINGAGGIFHQGTIRITGGGSCFVQNGGGAGAYYNDPVGASILNITTASAYSRAFIAADRLGAVNAYYGTLAGGGNVTGKTYDGTLNSVITWRAPGTVPPGTVAGTLSTGAQYLNI